MIPMEARDHLEVELSAAGYIIKNLRATIAQQAAEIERLNVELAKVIEWKDRLVSDNLQLGNAAAKYRQERNATQATLATARCDAMQASADICHRLCTGYEDANDLYAGEVARTCRRDILYAKELRNLKREQDQ